MNDPDFPATPRGYEYKGGEPPTSGLAITSLVCGIVSWVCIPIIPAIVAIATGHMALGDIRSRRGQVSGGTMATIGLVLGYVHLVLITIAVVVFGAMFAAFFRMAMDAAQKGAVDVQPGKVEVRVGPVVEPRPTTPEMPKAPSTEPPPPTPTAPASEPILPDNPRSAPTKASDGSREPREQSGDLAGEAFAPDLLENPFSHFMSYNRSMS